MDFTQQLETWAKGDALQGKIMLFMGILGLVAGISVAFIAIIADRLISAGADRVRKRLGLVMRIWIRMSN